MVTSAKRDRMKQEKQAEKQRLRESREAMRLEKEAKKQVEASEREKKRKEREAQEAEREMKRKEKEARKVQDEDKKREKEKEVEQRRKEREALEAEKEVKRKERELKKHQEDAEKEAKRKEREAEKETKRKEKEAAERKKQLVLEKQANIMSRLFRKKETDSPPENPQENRPESMSPEPEDVTSRVDEELKSTCTAGEAELLRNHIASWKSKSRGPFRHYGVRTAPKIAVSTELRLQGSARKVDLKRKRHEDEDTVVVLYDEPDAICTPPRKKQLRWKLLQFDKSHRPAFYGTMSKTSSTVGPRHPLKKDASLDYEVDSDEEWEEEDPGESLSDCEDKEEEGEKGEGEEDEGEADGFVVPDGYLSEEEGVHEDEGPLPEIGQCSKSSEAPKKVVNHVAALSDRKQQHHMKLFDNVIKHALQRNRPFLVNNLDPSREPVENQTERLCLQALRMVVMAPDIVITPPQTDS